MQSPSYRGEFTNSVGEEIRVLGNGRVAFIEASGEMVYENSEWMISGLKSLYKTMDHGPQ